MNIQISALSQTPIYEQIEIQLKEQVLTGALAPGTQLPSIRLMAKDLKVGIITVKRAYDDLCAEGITISLAGRGVFVADVDTRKIKETHMQMLSERLGDIRAFCETAGISKEELQAVIDTVYEGESP